MKRINYFMERVSNHWFGGFVMYMLGLFALSASVFLVILLVGSSLPAKALTVKIEGEECAVKETARSVVVTCESSNTNLLPVTPPLAVAPPPTSRSCGPVGLRKANVQSYYNAPGDAFNQRMSASQAYVLRFRTGSASATVQTIDIVEWSGAPNIKDVSLSLSQCDYVSPMARVAGIRPNIKFTVGIPVSKSTIRPDLKYPVLQPNTQYQISIRNVDPRTGAETCPTACGFNFKFFGTNG